MEPCSQRDTIGRVLALLRRPAWAIGALVAAVAVVGFARLGVWQLERLDGRRALNARAAAHLAGPPRALDDVLGSGGDVEYRRVEATGTFEPAAEVLVAPRARDGQPGFDVVTPLRLADGRALLVDRGWVPFAVEAPPVSEAPPPEGEVTVTGWLRRTAAAVRWTPQAGGPVEQTSDVDPTLLGDQVGAPLVQDAYLVAQTGAARGELPRSVTEPVVDDEGPHLSYAVQWFLFAAVVAIGFPVLVRRAARDDRAGVAAP